MTDSVAVAMVPVPWAAASYPDLRYSAYLQAAPAFKSVVLDGVLSTNVEWWASVR